MSQKTKLDTMDPKDRGSSVGLAASHDSPNDLISAEVAEVLRAEKSVFINVDQLLITVQEKAQTPQDILQYTEKVLELTAKFERQRLDDFKGRANAVIDAKNRDPDEIDKRANNRTRRHLKYVQAGVAVGSIASSVLLAVLGGPIVPIVMLLGGGTMSAALIPVLASGESVTSEDVAKIVNSVGRLTSKVLKTDKTEKASRRRR